MSAAKPEQQLIDKLKRIEPMKARATAVLIKMSALDPTNRSPNHVQMTLSAFNELAIKTQASLFALTCNDIMVVGQNIPQPLLTNTISSVKRIFQSDSFAASRPTEFIRLYPLGEEFDTVMNYAEKCRSDLENKQTQKQEIPLAPEHLDAILRNIQGFNIKKIIRRQEAIQISSRGITSLFLEYFTSMTDLKKAIAPDVNVLSNRWLFQHLSETLDKRILGIFKELFAHTPKNISLNLNISTIFTPAFEQFLAEMPEDKSIIVEVQLMDIIQNTHNYLAAKDLLHASGHQILIDGLHSISFEFLDMNILTPDLVKLNWTPALLKETKPEWLNEIDPERVILMRCENEESLVWGLLHKIKRFQGYFIDELTAAKARKGCAYKKDCTQAQCVARKAQIAGTQRSECQNPDRLDLPIEGKRRRG